MHIDSSSTTIKGRVYTRHLLRNSYRKNGKVTHDTIANLSKCSDEEIAAMKLALQNKRKISIVSTAALGIEIQQGQSVGALLVLEHVAKSIGLTKALGNTREGRLALFQIFARVIDQGSRLSAVRLCKSHDVPGILGIADFNEEDLYANLDWLTVRQDKIENALYKAMHPDTQSKNELFLYDVSSSYLEGELNELAEFGYNRDKKNGKRQIVLGLLCNQEGTPISIQVFDGNTNDTKTFKAQADKVSSRFGGGSVTFVGDGGMIKGPQIKDLEAAGFHYITSIGKRQISSLLDSGVLQLSFFDKDLYEIVPEDTGIRYLLRRNPTRMLEIRETRANKLVKLQKWLNKNNIYLQEHKRAKPAGYLTTLQIKIKSMGLGDFVECTLDERSIRLIIDADKQTECEQLDGCYVVKTDLPVEAASKELVHARYKALINVENAFRTCKTGHLELRPIYVRKASRTRGHALVVMLAYRLVQELAKLWGKLDLKVEEGLSMLGQYCKTELIVGGTSHGDQVQKPSPIIADLLRDAGVKLPQKWTDKKQEKTGGVYTKTTLGKNRKSR